MYDVIIVGARCAGAAAAMLLGRKGYRVLLVDRARFPSSIPQGHFIHRHGPARLARWGLLDRIVASNCPPVTSNVVDLGDFPLCGRDLAVNGVAFGYGPRRAVLDQILLQAALDAGAELRDGVSVERLMTDGDRVVGIEARRHGSRARLVEHAPMTIGADGRRSQVARSVGTPMYDACPALACWYFSYWSGTGIEGLEHYHRDQQAIFAHPTNDGLTAVFVGWPLAAHDRVRRGIETHFWTALDRVPSLSARLRAGRREDRFFGTGDLPNFFRKPYGPGWALVGDAGCHKDPYLALGLCDAFRDAELLVEAIDAGFSGRCSMTGALAAYERQRNESSAADFQRNLQAARLCGLPAEIYRIRAAVRGDREATNRYFMAAEGMIPRESVLEAARLQPRLETEDIIDRRPGPTNHG